MVKHLHGLLNNYFNRITKLPQLAAVQSRMILLGISLKNIDQLDLSQIDPVDAVYVLLAPSRNSTLSSIEAYQQTYVDSVQPIVNALKMHPIKRIIVVSSTRVYGENNGEIINDDSVILPKDEQGRLLLKMEQLWQQAYPNECMIVRPTGIYGASTARMVKLAETTKTYPTFIGQINSY